MHILIQNWNFFTLTSNALLERLKQTPEKRRLQPHTREVTKLSLSINSEYDENQGHSKIRFLKYNNNITLLLKAKL